MRGDFQERIAFSHRFVDESEFTIFQISNPAVNHVRTGAGCSLTIIATFDQSHVDSLHCQIAESRYTIDPATNDQYLSFGPLT